MNAQRMQETKSAVTQQKEQDGTGQGTARQLVRQTMASISENLKAERVQFALLISDQEASVMIQGRVKQGRIGELANGILNLTTTLVNEAASPAAS